MPLVHMQLVACGSSLASKIPDPQRIKEGMYIIDVGYV